MYVHVSRGLVNKHKLLFSFLIAVQMDMKINRKITPQEWEFFLQGLFILQLRNEAALSNNNVVETE